jgi:outer membrane protein OmpA-like peptidoglycan-associated protein
MRTISLLILLLFSFASFAQKRTTATIHFDTDKYNIRPGDDAVLDSLVASFGANSKAVQIEISGHCDERASNAYNDTLSLKRARSVEKYLLSRGVDQAMITKVKGYGETMPVEAGSAHSVSTYALDRRVEIVIITPEEKVVEKPVEKPVEPVVEKPVEKPVEKTLTTTIEDTATKKGTKIVLKNLNFVGGEHILLPQSIPILQELLSVMQNNPQLVIAIEGHVCCLPDKADGADFATGNYNLSEARAKTVYDYLVKNGIAPGRVSYKGFGHQFPIYPYPENSEEEKVQNRRVEIMIVNK